MVTHTLPMSVNIPYWDQWDFYTPLFNRASLWEIFRWQHGPHREGVGLVADKFILAWTHWNAGAESLLIVACFCAAALLAIFLKVKLFGRLSYADAVIPAMFLMLAHMGAVTVIPNPSYSGFPELLIMCYCLAWTSKNVVTRYSAVLLLNFLLIYTGFGFFIGIVTLFMLVIDIGRAAREKSGLFLPLIAVGFAAISFASFFWHFERSPAKLARCIEHPHLLDYSWFVALMFALFLGVRRAVVLASLVGGVVGVLLIWITSRHAIRLWRETVSSHPHRVITILGSFSLLFAIGAALGRTCLGMPGAAQSYRYLGLLLPGFLAIYFHLNTIRSGGRKIIALAVFLIAIIPPALRNHADPYTENGKRAWISCLQQNGTVSQCQQSTNFVLHPDPMRTHLQEKIDFLKRNRLSFYR